jgi:hypothetical protein
MHKSLYTMHKTLYTNCVMYIMHTTLLYTIMHKTLLLYTNCVMYIMHTTLYTMHKTLYTNCVMHKSLYTRYISGI